MGIAGIGSQTSNYYTQLSSGKRINKAADDAAGAAIAQKLQKQSTGYDVGASNAKEAGSMLKVADGGLSSITDSLQRIRELGVKASNSLYGGSERGAIQKEIDQLKGSITDASTNTKFNEMGLLDGSMGSTHIAANPDGGGTSINMPNSTLEALGIKDFDVTSGSFDISAIDKALEMVSGARSQIGAQSNGLDHTINFNQYSSYNMTESRSRIEDLDYGKAVSDMKKEQLLEEYQMNMQRKKAEDEGRVLRLFQPQ